VPDFFISYASPDEAWASDLASHLKNRGFSRFWAKDSLNLGRRYPGEIEKAIDDCRLFVPLIGNTVREHPFVLNEISHALAQHRTVVPIFLPGAGEGDLPIAIKTHQGLFANENAAMADIADRLCGILPTDSRPAQHHLVSGVILHMTLTGTSPDAAATFFAAEQPQFNREFPTPTWIGCGNDTITAILRADGSVAREVISRCLVLAMHYQLAAKELNSGTTASGIQLTVVIHKARGAEVRTLPSSTYSPQEHYVIGPDLHYARYLPTVFANRGYILLTDEASEHVSTDQSLPAFLSQHKGGVLKLPPTDCDLHLIDLTVHDIYKRQHRVKSLCVRHQGSVVVGDDRHPPERVSIEYRSEPTRTEDNTFVCRLVQADSVVIAGITNENLDGFLRAALEIRRSRGKQFWKELRIIFPSALTLDAIVDQHDVQDPNRARQLRRQRWDLGKKSVRRLLESQPANDAFRWQCLEFPGVFSFIGQRFSGPDSRSIRVAQLLPGCDMKEAYYMEVFGGSHVFERLDKSFSVMVSKSRALVEWNLCLTAQADRQYSFSAIVSRARLSQGRTLHSNSPEPCFPICLMMLYVREGRQTPCAVLQKRTVYNAASDFDKYSNISGWVISDDLWRACCDADRLASTPIFVPDPDLTDEMASLQFVRELNNPVIGGVIADDILDRTTVECAVRELREELGLVVVNRSRLSSRTAEWIVLPRNDCGANIFRILSLEITNIEYQQITASRPSVDLGLYEWTYLKRLHGKGELNHLLQQNFNTIFKAIYRQIGVCLE
jgi:hypothetical protein